MRLCFPALVLAVILSAGAAKGGLVLVPPDDPFADLGDPSENGGGGPPISHIGGLTFTFSSQTGTSPGTSPCVIAGISDSVCDFVNVSGQTWFNLVWTISPGSPFTTCLGTLGFTNCSVQQGDSTHPSIITFFGGPGISNAGAFGVSLVGWNAPTTVSVAANVPEPSSVVLSVTALVLIAYRAWSLRSQPSMCGKRHAAQSPYLDGPPTRWRHPTLNNTNNRIVSYCFK